MGVAMAASASSGPHERGPGADVIIRGATVITMDGELGVLSSGDVLIRGSQVTAVGRDLAVPADFRGEIVDGVGRIVLPGLVNAHLHTWQTSLRGLAAHWTLPEYFRWTHRGLASSFTPQDIHASTLAGALAQLDRGVTTLVDWCHNNPTPEHTDAAVDALVEAGIRAAFFHGSPKPDPKPGQPHFSRIPHPRSEIERLLAQSRFRRPGLLTLGLAVLGPHYSTADVAVADLELAAETGLVASMHQGGGHPVDGTAWSAIDNVLRKESGCLCGLPRAAARCRCKAAGHQVDHGPLDHRFRMRGQPLIVAAHPTVAGDPGVRALDHPPTGSGTKPDWPTSLATTCTRMRSARAAKSCARRL